MERERNPTLFGGNRFTLAVFGTHCSSGRAATTVPERWPNTCTDTIRLAHMVGAAGFEALVPIGRWKDSGGTTNFEGSTPGGRRARPRAQRGVALYTSSSPFRPMPILLVLERPTAHGSMRREHGAGPRFSGLHSRQSGWRCSMASSIGPQEIRLQYDLHTLVLCACVHCSCTTIV